MPVTSKTVKKTVKKIKTKQKSIQNSLIQKIKRKLKSIFDSIFWYLLSWRFVVFLWVLFVGMCLCYVFLFFSAARIETLITFPGRDINLKEITNHPAGLLVAENVSYTAPSGNTITGLYINNNSEEIVYYFHGNGAPIEYFYSDIQFISDLWFSRVFYENMQQELWFSDADVIIWWYSVGTALAVDFAKDRDFDSLILFSPLASRYDMAEKSFWFPLQKLFFLENSYISKEVIKTIDEPTLIIHGNTDKVVPFEQGKLLYENSAAQKKKFIEIDDFGHSLIPERYWEVLTGYVNDFLSEDKIESKIVETEIFLDKDLALSLLEKYQKQLKIENLDLVSDDSITKYVDPSVSFTQLWYIPKDMRWLEREFIVDSKWDAKMRNIAADAVEKMAEDFYSEFWEKIVVVSSYRSYNYQAGIKARGCPDHLCAKAGHSEHQSWLAVDFWSASSKQVWDNSQKLTKFYTWLRDNAHMYGFHNGYQNGVEIDWYDIEPWHWRYLWVDFSTFLSEQDITFAQHYYWKNK